MKHAPLDDASLREHVVGSWLLDPREPCDLVPPGEFAVTFTRAGDLVYSQRWSEGIERIFLTYRIEGGELVTDQPSAPREQRSRLVIDDAGRLHAHDLGAQTIFVRERDGDELDRDARLLALVAFTVRRSLTAASPRTAATPVLAHEDAEGRRALLHLDMPTPEEAHAAGELAALELHEAQLCAYALDGHLGGGTHGMHAIVVEASRRGAASGLLVAQPYTFDEHGRATPSGGLTPPEETPYSWLP